MGWVKPKYQQIKCSLFYLNSYFLILVLSKFPFKIFIKKLFLKGRVTNEVDMKTSGRCQRKYNKFEISQDYRDTENMNYRVISL